MGLFDESTTVSSILGKQNDQKPNLFGSLNTNTNTNTSSPFGAAPSSGFSAPAPQASSNAGKSLFDRITPAPATSAPSISIQPVNSIFGNATQSPQQTTSLFGNMGQQSQQGQQNQGGGMFANLGQSNQQDQGGGMFANLGQSNQQNTQAQGGNFLSAFGGSTQPKSAGTSTLGGSTLFGGGSTLFGQNTNQQNQQQTAHQQASNSLWGALGGLGQSTQQQQQGPQQGAFGQSILPPGVEVYPRTKPVMEQMDAALLKWHPQSPSSLFQTYLYNSVPPDLAPFYGPTPRDNETDWEEALRKKPSAGSIPIAVRGFFELGRRALKQKEDLDLLRGRLVEINRGLEGLLRTHDLSLSTRAVECRRRHLVLSRRCLALARKAQVLRSRGYALDGGEEELRKKLLALENVVCDPALSGRGEEIWARMVSIRERGRMLEREFEKAGRSIEKTGEIDEAVFKRCREILENHSSQISHLSMELELLCKELAEWEAGRNV